MGILIRFDVLAYHWVIMLSELAAPESLMHEGHTLKRLHALYRATALANRPYDEQFRSLLKAGLEMLGMEMGIISRIEGQDYTVLYAVSPGEAIKPGQQFPLGQTFCEVTLATGDVLHFADVERTALYCHPCFKAFRLHSYIGVPLQVNGKPFGTLNFSSALPREDEFDDADRDFFRLVGSWVSATLERQQADLALRASETRLRSILENNPDIIVQVNREYRYVQAYFPPAIQADVQGLDLGLFSPLDFVLADDHPTFRQAIDSTFTSRQAQSYECRGVIYGQNGFGWYLCRTAPIIEGDQVISVQIVFSDITARKEAEAALERERNLLRAFMKASPDAVYIKDAESRFTLVNQAMAAMLGYADPAELLGKTDLDVQPNHLGKIFMEEERHLLASSKIIEDRVAYEPLRDGTPRWTSTTKAPIVDAEGRITGLIGITRDITARKMAETENMRLFETSLDLLGSMNSVHYVRLNPAWERALGYSRAELYQTPFIDLVHPEDVERTLSNGFLLAEDQPITGFQSRLRAKDGQYRWFSWDVVPDIESGLFHISGRDITADKLLEDQFDIQHKALLESEARFRQMAETVDDCFWMYDPAADEYLYVSPAYERITGYPADRLYQDADGHSQLVIPEDWERLEPLLRDPTMAYDERYRIRQADGRMVWVWESVFAIQDESGKPYRVVGILRDVTAEKEAEGQIQQQNEVLHITNRELETARTQAEEASRLKSRFLATMSHELRTPLNAIIGYTQLQQAGLAGSLSAEQTQYLERTLVNAADLLRLINEVLDLSKIEAGRMELLRKSFAPTRLLQDIMSQHQVLAESRGLGFCLEGADALPPKLIGDAGRIKQMVVNLVANAIKFTERGQVRLRTAYTAERWIIQVVDTGIGVPAEMQATIFDEFRQVDGNVTRQHGGSGLGLAIVRKFVHLMNGDISVSSVMGEGSTFTLSIPLLPAADELSKPNEGPIPL
jgi:PAS domain S-box-containing protein